MPERDAATCPYNPFDLTKVCFHGDYPLIEVGVMELNRNPANYSAEVEQAENTARAMGDAPEAIKLRHIGNCSKADPAYGEGVAKALGLANAGLR